MIPIVIGSLGTVTKGLIKIVEDLEIRGRVEVKKEKRRKNKTCRIVDFAIPANHKVKLKESEKKDMYLDLAWEMKKKTPMEHKSDGDTNRN